MRLAARFLRQPLLWALTCALFVFAAASTAQDATPPQPKPAQPAAPAEEASEDLGPMTIEIDLQRLLFDNQRNASQDPVWRLEASTGKRILMLPFTVDNVSRANKLARFPISVRAGRFIGFVIPKPEVNNRAGDQIDLNRIVRAEAGELKQLLFDKLEGEEGEQQENKSPDEQALEPTPESAPRIAREITLHPDGTVAWEMDRGFQAATLQSASEQNPYAYKIDPAQLREAQPEKADRITRNDGESSRDFAARKRESQLAEREKQNEFRDLRNNLRKLPESFREAAPSVLYAAIEIPDSDDLTLQGSAPFPWTIKAETRELLEQLARGGRELQEEGGQDVAGKLVTMIEGHPLDARAVAIATVRSQLAGKVKADEPGYEVISRLLKSNDKPSRRIALYGVATVTPPTLDSAQLLAVAGEAALGEERKMLSFASLGKLFSTQATDPDNARLLIDRVSRTIADPEGPPAPSIIEQVLDSLGTDSNRSRGQLEGETLAVMISAIDLSAVEANEIDGVASAIIQHAPKNPVAAGWLDQKLLGSSDKQVTSRTLSLLYEAKMVVPKPDAALDPDAVTAEPTPAADTLVLSGTIPMTRTDHALIGLFDSADDLQQAAAWAVLGRFHIALPPVDRTETPDPSEEKPEDPTVALFDAILKKADQREETPASVVSFIGNQKDPQLTTVTNDRFVNLLADPSLAQKTQRAAVTTYMTAPTRYRDAVAGMTSLNKQRLVEAMYASQDETAPLMAALIADDGQTLRWFNTYLAEQGKLPGREAWAELAESRGESSLLNSATSDDTVIAVAAAAALVMAAGGDDGQEQGFAGTIALMESRTVKLVEEAWAKQRGKIFSAAFKRAQGTYQLVATLGKQAGPSIPPAEDAGAGDAPAPGTRIELGVVQLSAVDLELSLSVEAVALSPTPARLGIRIDEPKSLRSFDKAELSKIAPEHLGRPIDLLPQDGGVWTGTASLPDGQTLTVSLEPAN